MYVIVYTDLAVRSTSTPVIAVPVLGGPTASAATAIRYAKDIAIIIRLQDNQNSGLIYPPYVLINYVSAVAADYQEDAIAEVMYRLLHSTVIP